MLRVAILGGTGRFGKGLARRLVAGGHTVLIGSRDAVRGAEAAAEIGPQVLGLSNADAAAAQCDVVVMLVPPADAEATARELADVLDGACVVSVAANLVFAEGRPSLISDGDPRSLAERIAEAAPGRRWRPRSSPWRPPRSAAPSHPPTTCSSAPTTRTRARPATAWSRRP